MQNSLSQRVYNKIDVTSIWYKSTGYAWILFFIHPLSALIIAFKNYRLPYTKNILWLFVIYYGFNIIISDQGMDANRYRDNFITLSSSEVNTRNFVSLLYQDESSYVDAVQPLITFFVSRLTNDPRILFAVFGFVFGYFYSRNIWFLLDRACNPIKNSSFIYIFVFSIIVGFWNINGFRMWAAAHVFFFGAIQYILDNKKSGIFFAASSIFFHFAFMFPVSLFLTFIVMPKKVPIFYWFFIVTFFISELDISLIGSILTKYLPSVFHQRIEGYTNISYAQAVAEELQSRNWRFSFYSQSLKYVSAGFLSLFYFFGMKFFKENRHHNSLFCFSLFFLGIINLVSNIPSVHRFYSVAFLFTFALIFLYLQNAPSFVLRKQMLFISFPLLVIYCLGSIQVSFYTIGLITVFGNPLFALLPSIEDMDVHIKFYTDKLGLASLIP
jgi:hypothetical protein